MFYSYHHCITTAGTESPLLSDKLLGVETDGVGFRVFNIANNEVSSDLPTRELLRRYYPDVPVRLELGEHETLLSNRRAQEELGFQPAYTWMDAASLKPPLE